MPACENAEWFAVQTHPNRERFVHSVLENKGYELFLPLYSARHRWSDRIKVVQLPLFPTYLFCRLSATQRTLPLLTTPWVSQIVGAGRTPVPIPDHEIEGVRAIVKSGQLAQPWPFLKIGQRVRITYGPLEGVEGVLIATRKQYRLVVSVEMLQRSVGVEIDGALVESASFQLRRIAC